MPEPTTAELAAEASRLAGKTPREKLTLIRTQLAATVARTDLAPLLADPPPAHRPEEVHDYLMHERTELEWAAYYAAKAPEGRTP
ncbi:MAG: hypothetical protein NVS1B16_05620 [Pseudarthrobacter sp.]